MNCHKHIMIMLGSFIACLCLNILSNDNNWQQNQLQKCLRNPGNNNKRIVRSNCCGERNKSECCEYICTPHGTNYFCDTHGKNCIKSTNYIVSMDFLLNMFV